MTLQGYSLLQELQERAAGRRPDHQLLVVPATAYPVEDSDGVEVSDAIVAMVAVALRLVTHAHSSWVTIETADYGDTYTITVDGNDVVYDASAASPALTTEEELLLALRDAVNADGTVNAIVDATVATLENDSNGDPVRVLMLRNTTGTTAAHTTAVAAAGSGALDFGEDAQGCDVKFMTLQQQDNRASLPEVDRLPWLKPNGAAFTGLDFEGFLERFEIASAGQMIAILSNISSPTNTAKARIRAWIGPCEREVQT